jgi:hypothetical protein
MRIAHRVNGRLAAAIFVPSKTAVGRVLTNYGQTSVVIYFIMRVRDEAQGWDRQPRAGSGTQ